MNRPLTPDELVSIRRDLHSHPELSHRESRTADVIAAHLRTLGLEPRVGVAGHGVVADVVGAHDGPTLLYRADIDALPIQEVDGRAYGSQNPGVMHACGHDVHTTIGLGVASAIAARSAEVHGRVRFVFQPAEEAAPPPGEVIGAEKMVVEGVLEAPAVDAAFALHVMPLLDVGTLGFTGGPVWAASDLFDIHVTGAMAHGAYPHEGADPIAAASAIVQALQQIPSRNVDTRDACVVSVCRFQAGSAYNIIPDGAHLQGLVRTHDEGVRDLALRRLREVAEQTARAWGCEATIETVRGTYATVNDLALEQWVVDRVGAVDNGLTPTPFRPQMGAEDFAAFSRRVPGCYLLLGVRNEARGIVHMIHTPGFDVDETCLQLGVDAMVDALLHTGAHFETLRPQLGAGASAS